MKILVMNQPGRLETFIKDPEFYKQNEIVTIPFNAEDEAILAAGADADILLVDAIARLNGNVIRKMKNLKLIHTDGVGYNWIDTEAAKECGVYVCNCKSMNASSVAEQTVLLMLGLLRNVVSCDAAVRDGRQKEVQSAYIKSCSLKEIADCRIGLIGFGDIARIVAKLCSELGAEVVYNDIAPASEEIEASCHASFLPVDELLATSDIVSLHVPVTKKTEHMVNTDYISKMKNGAYLINTARGELVVAEDLLAALKSGHLAGAGLDCLEGEPVNKDNAMLAGDPETESKILYSPHIGGISASSFKRGYQMICDDIMAVARGEKPQRCVNM